MAAFSYYFFEIDGRTENREQNRRAGIDHARRALESAGEDSGTQAFAAVALAYFGENIDAIMALVDRVLALNPSFARGWIHSGTLRIWAGQLDLGIEHVRKGGTSQPAGPPRYRFVFRRTCALS
jgi:hypothetical protein